VIGGRIATYEARLPLLIRARRFSSFFSIERWAIMRTAAGSVT
jgi:hypothetical protein